MQVEIIFKLFFERLVSMKTFTLSLAQRKRKRKFRTTKRNINGMTAKHIAENEGRGIDAIRKRWNTSFPGISFSADAELSPEMITALSKEKAASAEKPERGEKIVKLSEQKPVVSKGMPPVKKPKTDWFVFWPSLFITAASILLTITGLFVFAHWAGGLLGLMFALFLFIAVMVARDRMKGDTSKAALLGVLRLELGAAGLHCFTFWRLLPEFPAGAWFFAARIALCISLAGFAAFLSYSAVLTVRNYNAET